MDEQRSRRTWPLVTLMGLTVAIAMGAILSGCVTITTRAQAQDTVSLALDVPIGTPARVETFNGAVTVSPSSGSRILAEVLRTGQGGDDAEAVANRDAIDVTLELIEGVALLRAVYTPDPGSVPDGSGASVTLRVPAQTALQLVSSNGPIDVRDTWGGTDARTSNGPVRLSEMVGPVLVQTSNGPVDVEAGEPVSLTVRTSNAGIAFEGALQPGEHRLETSNGPVRMAMPADAAFTVDATTSASKATSEFAIQASSEESTLQGSVGEPDAAAATVITIRTSNSPISLTSTEVPTS